MVYGDYNSHELLNHRTCQPDLWAVRPACALISLADYVNESPGQDPVHPLKQNIGARKRKRRRRRRRRRREEEGGGGGEEEEEEEEEEKV